MSFRETPRQKPRPRWAPQLDIEGVPRERHAREQRTEELRTEYPCIPGIEPEELKVMPQTELDINKPPRLPYAHQEYPKLLYKGTTLRKVVDAADEKKAKAEGFGKPDAAKILAQRKRENVKAFKGKPPGLEETDAAEEISAAK